MHTSIFHLHIVFYFFWFFLHKLFGPLLGPWSFDNIEKPLDRRQVSFPIIFGGVGFILTSMIAPIVYLGNWAIIALVIIVRFMIDQHPFFLETLAQVDNNTFFFQQHFKTICDLYHPQSMFVFLYLNNSSSNKWFNFKIPSHNVYAIIPFLACSLTEHQRSIVLKFYHVLALG